MEEQKHNSVIWNYTDNHTEPLSREKETHTSPAGGNSDSWPSPGRGTAAAAAAGTAV